MYKISNRPYRSLMPTSLFESLLTDTGEDLFKTYKTGTPYNISNKVNADGKLEKVIIEVALAGYDKNDIKLKCIDNELQILVDKKEEKVDESIMTVHKGISSRSLQLKFNLLNVLNTNEITSTFVNGMLTIEIPAAKENVIDIKIN